ncbi:hypothetical protein BpHYR1_049450 [Brachionus plicatilis]|uniref:Uncharacterized protein n=1 Tax=Brachionus plicatilis TaxID=10195 RepID=A0A3M7SB71_BRAPC|nr:hypothetical protein BpHYR1_049450 [Brachionus plicatilis]
MGKITSFYKVTYYYIKLCNYTKNDLYNYLFQKNTTWLMKCNLTYGHCILSPLFPIKNSTHNSCNNKNTTNCHCQNQAYSLKSSQIIPNILPNKKITLPLFPSFSKSPLVVDSTVTLSDSVKVVKVPKGSTKSWSISHSFVNVTSSIAKIPYLVFTPSMTNSNSSISGTSTSTRFHLLLA